MNKTVIAILCSDIHLSAKAPIARSAEPDWYEAMRRPLRQLQKLRAKYPRAHGIIGGDIFHHWKSPPELVNFALKELPDDFLVIPGQHDLPYHSYSDMDKSALGTLIQVGKVKLIPPCTDVLLDTPNECPMLIVRGFPWGVDIAPVKGAKKNGHVYLAVAHAYCWQKGSTYVGADKDQRAVAYRERLKGYDAALFGDNHKPFKTVVGSTTVFNHGGFMRRNTDERDMMPSIGLLLANGDIELVPQYVGDEKWLPRGEVQEVDNDDFDLSAFLKELTTLDKTSVNFHEAVNHYISTREVSKGTRRVLLEALESHGS